MAPFQETQDNYFILSGLLPGTEYKFLVIAWNSKFLSIKRHLES